MNFRDWILVTGLMAALPLWVIAVRNQWSRKPGSTGRMLRSCAAFAAIIAVTLGATFLAS